MMRAWGQAPGQERRVAIGDGQSGTALREGKWSECGPEDWLPEHPPLEARGGSWATLVQPEPPVAPEAA